MSNQVYSNFADRELYRSSDSLDCNTMGPNQIVPQSPSAQHVGPFLALPPNANYSYNPLDGVLTFHTEGVYSIGLTTSWFLTVVDGRIRQYMLLNDAALPNFGDTAIRGYVSPINQGPSMASNITLKLNVDDNITFWCSGSNSGVQTIVGSAGNPRSEYFVSKIS